MAFEDYDRIARLEDVVGQLQSSVDQNKVMNKVLMGVMSFAGAVLVGVLAMSFHLQNRQADMNDRQAEIQISFSERIANIDKNTAATATQVKSISGNIAEIKTDVREIRENGQATRHIVERIAGEMKIESTWDKK